MIAAVALTLTVIAGSISATDFTSTLYTAAGGTATFCSVMPDQGDATNTFLLDQWVGHAGWNIKADKFTGKVQIGFKYTKAREVYHRHIWGKWQFNENMSLLMGQTNGPTNVALFSGQVTDGLGLTGWGAWYTGRRGVVILDISGFQIGLLNHNEPIDDGKKDLILSPTDTALSKITKNNVKANIPRLELSYKYKGGDMFFIQPFAGVQYWSDSVVCTTYKSAKKDTVATIVGKELNLTPFVVGLNAQVKANKLTVNLCGAYSVNAYNYGYLTSDDEYKAKAYYDVANSDVSNATTICGAANMTYAVTDKATSELGFGASTSKNEIKGLDEFHTIMNIYANTAFSVTDFLTVTPEVTFLMHGENKNTKTKGNNDLKVVLDFGYSF